MADARLGRILAPDARDRRFSMALALPTVPLPSYKYWTPGTVLDQGQSPHCVAYSWTGWGLATPIRTRLAQLTPPDKLYAECKAIDGYAGDGTTVRAGVQIMQRQGRIKNYLWAQTPAELTAWLLTMGPVVVGTEWTSEMFTPDARGFVHPRGSVEGGHAYLVTGFNAVTRNYRCRNSWGGWGQSGNFWISEADMHALIFDRDGEACAAVEQAV